MEKKNNETSVYEITESQKVSYNSGLRFYGLLLPEATDELPTNQTYTHNLSTASFGVQPIPVRGANTSSCSQYQFM